MEGQLPSDFCRTEGMMSVTSYVTMLEDLLLQVQINIAVAKGFQGLEFPNLVKGCTKKYIDLWPIQMSAEIFAEENGKQNVLTTNLIHVSLPSRSTRLKLTRRLRYPDSPTRCNTEHSTSVEESVQT